MSGWGFGGALNCPDWGGWRQEPVWGEVEAFQSQLHHLQAMRSYVGRFASLWSGRGKANG